MAEIPPEWEQDKLLIEFWPSPEEIHFDAETDPYSYTAGLNGFYMSLDTLMKDSKAQYLPFQWYTYLNVQRGEKIARKEPEVIVQILMWLSSAGIGSGLFVTCYKLLNLWVKKVNGRKIKVKFDNIEIETSQLSEKQFVQLLSRIIDLKQRPLDRELDSTQLHMAKVKELSSYNAQRILEPLEDQALRQVKTLYHATKEEREKQIENTQTGTDKRMEAVDDTSTSE